MRLHFVFLVSLKSVKEHNQMQFASFNNEDDIFVFILLGTFINSENFQLFEREFFIIRKHYFYCLYQTFA